MIILQLSFQEAIIKVDILDGQSCSLERELTFNKLTICNTCYGLNI